MLTSLEWQLNKQLQFSDVNPPNRPLEYCIHCFLCIPNERSPLVLSGNLEGHAVGPPRPIHHWGKQSSKWSLTCNAKWGGAPSCWKTYLWGTTNRLTWALLKACSIVSTSCSVTFFPHGNFSTREPVSRSFLCQAVIVCLSGGSFSGHCCLNLLCTFTGANNRIELFVALWTPF